MIDSLVSLFSKTSNISHFISHQHSKRHFVSLRGHVISSISFTRKVEQFRSLEKERCKRMFAQPAAATNQGIVSQYTVTSFHACTSIEVRSVERALKMCDLFCKRVEQHCCAFYYPRIKPVCKKSGCCQLGKVVAKVESSATLRNTCYAFSRPTTILFCNYSCVRAAFIFKLKKLLKSCDTIVSFSYYRYTE